MLYATTLILHQSFANIDYFDCQPLTCTPTIENAILKFNGKITFGIIELNNILSINCKCSLLFGTHKRGFFIIYPVFQYIFSLIIFDGIHR